MNNNAVDDNDNDNDNDNENRGKGILSSSRFIDSRTLPEIDVPPGEMQPMPERCFCAKTSGQGRINQTARSLQ